LGLNWTKITNIGIKLNIKHWLWQVVSRAAGLIRGYLQKKKKKKKKKKKRKTKKKKKKPLTL